MAFSRQPNSPAAFGAGPSVVGLVLLVLLAAGVRGAWVIYRYGGEAAAGRLEFPDEQDYWSMARSLAAGRIMSDADGHYATRMPGYPAFLSVWVGSERALVWARLSQALLGASVVIPVTWLARRLDGRRPAVVAGLLAAVDPFSVFFGGLLLSETLLTAALWWLMWLTWPACDARRAVFWARWTVASATAAAGCYLHPSAAVLGPLVLGVALLRTRPAGRSLLAGGAVACVMVLALSPWAHRNQRVIGQWRWLTTRAGISLYDGVGPLADGSSNLGYTRKMAEIQGLGEAEWDRYFRQEGLRLMRHDPGRVLRLAGVKLRRTWSPLPHAAEYQSAVYRALSAAWMVPLLLLTLLGAWSWRRRWPDVLLLLLPAIGLTAMHMILPGSVRYRLPAMPGLLILAAGGVAGLGDYARRFKTPHATRTR